MAFSCGARSAFGLNEGSYLRNMLSRRQLQGFVMRGLRPTALDNLRELSIMTVQIDTPINLGAKSFDVC